MFEELEGRRLLSVSFNPATGLLTVTGTDRANVIRLNRDGAALRVTVDGTPTTHDAAAVKRIVVSAKGGPDSVVLDATVTAPAALNGGPGNDVLRGGSGDDTVKGDGGHDILDGGAGGADVFIGGGGADLADYSKRTDDLAVDIGRLADDGAAGEGDRVGLDVENITGGAGDDRLAGRSGANVLNGGGGDDHLDGLDGNDTLKGGDGDDLLVGGRGSDRSAGG